MIVQLPTHANERRVAALQSSQQQTLHFATDRCHPTLQRGTTDFAVVETGPVFEQFARRAAQVVAEPFGLTVAFVNLFCVSWTLSFTYVL